MTQKKLIVIVTAAAAAVAALVFILSAVLRKGSEPKQQSQSSDNSYSASDENGGSSYSEPNSSETGSAANTSSSSSNVSRTDSTSSDISAETSDAPDSTSSDTSGRPIQARFKASEPSEETSDDSPQWTETKMSAELYVNTNNIGSRAYAIQGSDTVKQYGLNEKVTVTAKTDTDYYRLDDGTFIHCDYLSENEVKPHYGGLGIIPH